MPDIFRLQPAFGLRLDIHSIELAKAVEVVDESATHRGRHRLKDLINRYAQGAGLFAIEINLHLRVVRIERSKDVTEFGALPRRGDKLSRLVTQLVHRHRAAAILDQKVEAGSRAESGERGNVERENHSFGNGGKLPLQFSHNPSYFFRFLVAFFPRFQACEQRSVVGLESVGDNAKSADCLIRLDGMVLTQDLFDLLEHLARALE